MQNASISQAVLPLKPLLHSLPLFLLHEGLSGLLEDRGGSGHREISSIHLEAQSDSKRVKRLEPVVPRAFRQKLGPFNFSGRVVAVIGLLSDGGEARHEDEEKGEPP